MHRQAAALGIPSDRILSPRKWRRSPVCSVGFARAGSWRHTALGGAGTEIAQRGRDRPALPSESGLRARATSIAVTQGRLLAEATPLFWIPTIRNADNKTTVLFCFRMELRHLRYFCAVAEHGSFTTAARQLNVSQSGVSGQVRDLEEEIGVSLFRRNRREVTLTPEGSVFLHEAREILIRADRAIELTLRSSKGMSGTLTVGLCGPATAAFLPKLIRKFRKEFSGVTVALRELNTSEQIEALLNGHIDIAFTRGIPVESRALLGHELFVREPLVVALPKGHPLSGEQTIALNRLAKDRLILYFREGAPEVFDAILAMCKRAKFSPRIGDTPRSWQSILTMVEAGEGVAIVPSAVQYLRADDVIFRPLMDKRCKVDAIIAWRRNQSSTVVDSFLALLRAKRAEIERTNTF